MKKGFAVADLDPRTILLLGGLAIGLAFGAIARWSAFCVRGAAEDLVSTPDAPRLRGYLLAAAVALLGTQALIGAGLLDVGKTLYLPALLPLGGVVLGGLAFGVGMVLTGGCGARLLVLAAGGNLRSLVSLMVLAIAAYTTLRGLLALPRQAFSGATGVDLKAFGLADQSLTGVAAKVWGVTSTSAQALVVAALVLPALAYVFRRRVAPRHLIGGALIGLLVPAGFAVTGILAADEFNPLPPESITVTGPLAQTLVYGLTYTGATMDFGIAWVLGISVGAALVAVLRGEAKLQGFEGAGNTARYLVGGVLMGVGGVLSIGCTIGQGLTGVSTLSIGSLLAITAIFAGAILALKRRQIAAALRQRLAGQAADAAIGAASRS
ncbi:YeeE/YedE family protein [Vineibacter terrae]|uniref:YeeE/YedE family protein n=1 Tax=Vineibacter terrae TaxID=2586908 RepID=A0A5C8PE25_9HYPH|nr:YeeE/YedE family protein [Vineibacter terrae]TXL71396.1 YeeE/YedE family protein [Vineibacter terrae]